MLATRAFDRWVRKERIRDAALVAAIDGADAGLVDADLKECLVKLRVARPGAGKRDGYRTIVAYQTQGRAFFLYGFAKNDRANIDENPQEAFETLMMWSSPIRSGKFKWKSRGSIFAR